MKFELNTVQSEAMRKLLQDAGSNDPSVAIKSQRELAKAIETPLRKAVLSGDILSDIFSREDYTDGRIIQYPLDLLSPGKEGNYVAHVVPEQGKIPVNVVSSDSILNIPTFRIGSAIGCSRKFLRDAQWNVIARMAEILEAAFVKKNNDSGFNVLISSGVSRNVIAFDPDAAAGQFTPRLITLMKNLMRRNGGGNSSSINRGKLTHLFISPEAKDDIRSWNLNLVSDQVRTNIYYTTDNGVEVMKIFDVELRDIDELGVGQEYQAYYTTTLGKAMPSGDTEIVVGIDKSKNDSFMNPVRENLQIFEDNTLHRENRFELYGSMEGGYASLDNRRVILGSL